MFYFNELPIINIKNTFHIGTLNLKDSNHAFSLEGNLISTSLCPKEWLSLLHKKHKVNYYRFHYENAFFLDILSFLNDEKYQNILNNILTQAVNEGLIYLQNQVYRYHLFEDEEEEINYCDFLSLDELIKAYGDDGEENYQIVSEYYPTDLLIEKYKGQNISAKSFAILHILSRELPEITGIFWNYNFDLNVYSLPVIAILPEKLNLFNIDQIKYEELPDF